MDDDRLAREAARYFGFSEGDGQAARAALNLPSEWFRVRFTELANFAKTFGVNIAALAEFIANSTSGIEPWQPRDRISPQDRDRIREAIVSRGESGGDWAGAILSLLNELENLRPQRGSGQPSPGQPK
jgi:hypothetical protein